MSRIVTIPVLLATLAACGSNRSPAEAPAPQAVVVVEEVPTVDTAVPFEVTAPVQVEEVDLRVEALLATTPYLLRRGETLAHFARWSQLPVEDIADASALPLDEPLQVGTEVLIPLTEPELLSALEVARDAHHTRRAVGYLDTRGGSLGTEFYKVRTGDSAWTIARDHAGLPVWLIESYNPSLDLERLRPGQELMLPIIADTVAQLPE